MPKFRMIPGGGKDGTEEGKVSHEVHMDSWSQDLSLASI